MSAGVLFGAATPHQLPASKPGTKSLMEGTSGSAGDRTGHGEGAKLAIADVLDPLGYGVEHDLDLPGKQVNQRGRPAAIGHVKHVDTGHHLKKLADHVERASVAARRKTEPAGIGLCVGDKFRNGLGRNRRMDLHDVGDTNHAGHHGEITDRTEFELIVQSRIDGIGREHDEERVAVRRRSHDRFGRNVARGARTVLDNERLTETL